MNAMEKNYELDTRVCINIDHRSDFKLGARKHVFNNYCFVDLLHLLPKTDNPTSCLYWQDYARREMDQLTGIDRHHAPRPGEVIKVAV